MLISQFKTTAVMTTVTRIRKPQCRVAEISLVCLSRCRVIRDLVSMRCGATAAKQSNRAMSNFLFVLGHFVALNAQSNVCNNQNCHTVIIYFFWIFCVNTSDLHHHHRGRRQRIVAAIHERKKGRERAKINSALTIAMQTCNQLNESKK